MNRPLIVSKTCSLRLAIANAFTVHNEILCFRLSKKLDEIQLELWKNPDSTVQEINRTCSSVEIPLA